MLKYFIINRKANEKPKNYSFLKKKNPNFEKNYSRVNDLRQLRCVNTSCLRTSTFRFQGSRSYPKG